MTERADWIAILTAIGDDAAEVDGPPPSALRNRVLDTALAARPPGRALGESGRADALAAFRRQLAGFERLADRLTEADWPRPTAADWSIGQLMAHLIAVEEYFGSVLGLWSFDVPEGTIADHRAMTQVTVDALATLPMAAVIQRWRETIGRLDASIGDGADLPPRVEFHTLPMSTRSVFITRAFELWTHAEDIRRALALPLEAAVPPAGDLNLMVNVAVRSIPTGLLLTGVDPGARRCDVVLTGPGGGTWSLGLGANPPDEPDAVLVADTVEFCRMVASRLAVEAATGDVDGDRAFAADLCLAARIFAA